jgi:hypothetical protein
LSKVTAKAHLVNLLLTISIKVNVLVSDMSRHLTTGDDHEVQESASDPWTLELALRLRLERRWRHGLIEFRPFRPVFSQNYMGDLRLGADRFLAFLGHAHGEPPCRSQVLSHLPNSNGDARDSNRVNRYWAVLRRS